MLPAVKFNAVEPELQKLVVVAARVPAAGVPEQAVFRGCVNVMSSITTQQSGVVPITVA